MTHRITLVEFLENSIDEPTNLPSQPTPEEVILIRKGLRKKKIPDVSILPTEFEYEGVGRFQKKTINSDFSFEWKALNGKENKSSFTKLCMDPTEHLNRLELGWMIANFARLDCLTYLSKMRPTSYEDHHQNHFNKQYAIQKRHFMKIEMDWRHWSVVMAGNMLF